MSNEKFRIVILNNDYKVEGSNEPDYRAFKSVKGEDLERIGSFWINESDGGVSYLSGTLDDHVTLEIGESEFKKGKAKGGAKPKASKSKGKGNGKSALPF